ncbi:MAG: class I SAM-dependent methyltransferase, partial [Acidobacteria bacterium]|nr:class I SAM-dependent methyltransferase [Acidobacteriota bacterium]
DRSLGMIEATGLGLDARIIDVGGGASTLVDDLWERGYKNLTVLDISAAALENSKRRLGEAAQVDFIAVDITNASLPQNSFDLWHDRAVFHFLTSTEDRSRYIDNLKCSLKPGGSLIIATFAEDGPLKCSGLDVERYDLEKLVDTLGNEFALAEHARETHQTPFDTQQSFLYARFVFTGK